MSSSNIVIIGGGPAGLAAAIAARQRDFVVTVVDGNQPPIDKACGEGLLPESQTALKSLGVQLSPVSGFPFRGICFAQADARVHAEFRQGPALGLRRTILHQELIGAATDCGVQMRWNTPVTDISADRVHTPQGSLPARWIIGADGGSSLVRRWSGLNSFRRYESRFATRRHYCVAPWSEFAEVHWGRNAQAYITPTGPQEICLVLLARDRQFARFETALSEWPQLHARLASTALASPERGAITSMHSLRHVTRGNVALVGDASGGVDAITGEGLRLAFCQAPLLADALTRNDLNIYERAHRELARRPALMGTLLLHLSKRSTLRERVLRTLSANPSIFGGLLEVHEGRGAFSKLAQNSFALGLGLLTN